MLKNKAIKQAKAYKRDTNMDAYVIDCGNRKFDWFCRHYFENGFEGGKVVWSTEEME